MSERGGSPNNRLQRTALRAAAESAALGDNRGGAAVLAEELLAARRCAAASVDSHVPLLPGYYAIFVDNPDSLGEPFAQVLRSRQTQLIYVGIATGSLRERLVGQDLRHEQPSTFFRGIGAVLGFRPPAGSLVGKANQNNYKFSPADTRAIISWVNEHLSVSWIEASPVDSRAECTAIASLRPLMNTSRNPDRLPELAQLRDECRQIARSLQQGRGR